MRPFDSKVGTDRRVLEPSRILGKGDLQQNCTTFLFNLDLDEFLSNLKVLFSEIECPVLLFIVSDSLGKFSFGFCIYSTVVAIVNIKLWFQSRSWNFPLVGSIIFSVSVFIIFNIGLAYLRINTGVLNFFTSVGFDTNIISTFPPEPDIFR